MTTLKLLALDEEDLQIVSAHLQDALLRSEDMIWLPGERRLVALLNRFDWDKANESEARGRRYYERRRCALRFDKVDAVKVKGITPGRRGQVFELLAITFAPAEAPAGQIQLVFAEDRSIRLDVECVEVALTDLGEAWKTRLKPEHE